MANHPERLWSGRRLRVPSQRINVQGVPEDIDQLVRQTAHAKGWTLAAFVQAALEKQLARYGFPIAKEDLALRQPSRGLSAGHSQFTISLPGPYYDQLSDCAVHRLENEQKPNSMTSIIIRAIRMELGAGGDE